MNDRDILIQKLALLDEINHYYNLLGYGVTTVYASKLMDMSLLTLRAKVNNLLVLLKEPSCAN